MNKAQAKVFSEMQSELAARKRVLLAEKEQLQKATARIAEIDEELSVIDSEDTEYKDAIDKLPKDTKEASK